MGSPPRKGAFKVRLRTISCVRRALSVVLFAVVCSSAGADDQTTVSRPAARHWIDFRFSVNVGAFYYMQRVEGGYYINGYPYDLDWYGLLGETTGSIELSLPLLKGVGIGIGGCLQYAVNPAAVNENSRFAERADSGALGGYGGVSASYGFGDRKLNAIAGYGGTGVAAYYGGSGPAVSVGIDYPIVKGTVRLGIGTRYLFMYLYHPGSVSVRPEQGPYMAFTVSAVVDWIP